MLAREKNWQDKSRLPRRESLETESFRLYKLANDLCEKSEQLEICPICGEKLSKDPGLYFRYTDRVYHSNTFSEEIQQALSAHFQRGIHRPDFVLPDLDSVFLAMDIINKPQDYSAARNAVKEHVEVCDLPVILATDAKAETAKNDNEALKKYIFLLIQQENNIYSLQQQLADLYYRRLVNSRDIIQEINGPAYKYKTELNELQTAYQDAKNAVEKAKRYRPSVSVDYPEEPKDPVLGKPGLFNKKKVLSENEMLIAKYQAALAVYQKKVQLCDEEKARLIAEKRATVLEEAQNKAESARASLDKARTEANRKIKSLDGRMVPAKAFKETLDKEIAETEELLRKTFAARNALYAYNIIFGKYRDVVALSSFYEYLTAGRCTALEGADGAYNIYENEIRLNHVISQLDAVITSLEEIKQNQYMMYQELRSINSSLSRLNSTMDKALTAIQGIEANTTSMNEYMEHISKNSDVIAHNTAVTAYYSKINAELTNALGFMAALK